MTYNPNANWTAAVAETEQAPVYYIVIDGHSTHYATHAVSGSSKTVLMGLPTGGGTVVDVIDGTQTIAAVTVPLYDVASAITDLLSTEAAGAPLTTLINRKATIYGGWRLLDVADYAPIYTGRISAVELSDDLTHYILTLASLDRMLDGQIMKNATDAKPTTIRGNVVNVYWSILTGTFSTVHATFPLTFVSTATGSTSAPTGLGLATTLIDETKLVTERDAWHAEDIVNIEYVSPIDARDELESELFRIFQCFPTISGDGKMGLKFHAPALPAADATVVDKSDVVEVVKWERMFQDHLNKFTCRGDWNNVTETFGTQLYPPASGEPTEDTDNQTATAEIIEYAGDSKWLKSGYNGAEIALELMGRLRVRYLYTPARIEVDVLMTSQPLEQGDVIALTHPHLPDMFVGTRGLVAKTMTIVSRSVQFAQGTIRLVLLDTGYRRYGVIAPNTKATTYTGASDRGRNTFAYIADASGNMSDATKGYRLI